MDYVKQSSSAFAALYPPTHARHGSIARIHGLILRDRGQPDEAESELRRAADILAKSAGKEANITIDTELQLADVLATSGNKAEARTLYDRVAPLLPTRFVDTSAVRRQCADLGRRLGSGTPTRD
jgi:serine/threonine-protein kinase